MTQSLRPWTEPLADATLAKASAEAQPKAWERERELLEVGQAELSVRSGPDQGLRVPLSTAPVTIGSAAGCTVRLQDPAVSPRHAEIVPTERGYVIRDLGSTGGVWLGGWIIDQAPVSNGMVVTIGNTTLLLHEAGREETTARPEPGQSLMANSVTMRAAVAALEQFAQADLPVLIEGETGTGKERAARWLHSRGSHSRARLVTIDCRAVDPAFAGAGADSFGFERARGATVLLDEVGELSIDLQTKLLAALEHAGQGSIRVIATTGQNLEQEVRRGRFRVDLFLRLAICRVRLPPLRERPEDFEPLLRELADELGVEVVPQLIERLRPHSWPGNVRELRNVLARMAIAPDAPMDLLMRDFAQHGPNPLFDGQTLRPFSAARRLARDEFERRYLAEALTRTRGNLSDAARQARVTRQLFTRLAAKYKMRQRDR